MTPTPASTGRAQPGNGPSLPRQTDAALIELTRAGDPDAFGALWLRHEQSARRYAGSIARPDSVDDVVSEAFANTLRRIRTGTSTIENFRAYLLRSVRNAVIDNHRTYSRHAAVGGGAEEFDLIAPPVIVEDSTDLDLVLRAFGTLSHDDQAVLRATVVDGAKPSEVAALFGASPAAVATRSFRARERLREAWLVEHTRNADTGQCATQRSRMGAYIRGSLAAKKRADLERHLDTCESCRHAIAEVTHVNHSLRGIALWLPVGAAAAAPAVRRRTRHNRTVRPSRLGARVRRPVIAGTLASGLVLVLGLAALIMTKADDTTPSADRTAIPTYAASSQAGPSTAPSSASPARPRRVPTRIRTSLPVYLPVAPVTPTSQAPVTVPTVPTQPAPAPRSTPRSRTPRPTPPPSTITTPVPTPTPSPTVVLPGPNLVTFAGFQDPPVPAGGFLTFCPTPACPASTFSGGWSATGEGVDVVSPGMFPVPAGDAPGTQSVDLNSAGPNSAHTDGIERAVTTVAGATYRLTFALAGNTVQGPAVKTGSVLVDGAGVLDFSFDITGHDTSSSAAMGWVTKTVDLVAASTSTVLHFVSTTTGSNGPLITDVSFNQIA